MSATATHQVSAPPAHVTLRWAAPHLASLGPRPALGSVLMMAGAVLTTAVDVLLMYPAVARVLRHSVMLSWLTAAGLGVTALLAASWAGWLWRGARGNHSGSPAALALPGALLGAWAAGGLGIMAMRLTSSRVTTAVAYDGQSAAGAGATNFDGVAAAVFLVVYVLCGVLAFSDFYERRNDAHAAGREALLELDKERQQAAPAEALYQQLVANSLKRRTELAGVDLAATMACDRNATFAAELRQVARIEMATAWGDPTKTGITSAHHPTNPAFTATPGTDEEEDE